MTVKMPTPITVQLNRLWIMGAAGGSILHLISTLEVNYLSIEAWPQLDTLDARELSEMFNFSIQFLSADQWTVPLPAMRVVGIPYLEVV